MNNLLTALTAKLSGSALSTAVGGRMFLDEAPENTEFPYVVYQIITSVPDDTFTEEIEDTLIQFSLFSTSKSAVEITAIYAALKALIKNAVLTVTAGVNLWLDQRNLVTMTDEITTDQGTVGVKHWAVDYSVLIQKI